LDCVFIEDPLRDGTKYIVKGAVATLNIYNVIVSLLIYVVIAPVSLTQESNARHCIVDDQTIYKQG
jgi:hypothetical protein